MRIAFVGTGDASLDRYPPGGGIERQVWVLAHQLAGRGHDVEVLTRHREADLGNGVRLVQIPVRGDGHVLPKVPMSVRAALYLREHRPDVVYLSEKWVSLVPSRLDLPRIYATHNKDAFEYYRRLSYKDHRLNHLFFPVKRRIEEGEMRRVEVVAANSRSVLEYLRGRRFANAEYLPMAVETDEYGSGGEEDPPYIFTSGQLLPVKGVHFLVEAFARVAAEHPRWRLVVGGRGPERERLARLASRLGVGDRVSFLDWTERARYVQTLARCAFFVLPSLAETFGTVVIEAMASGKPVVASRVEGPRDTVQDGVTGILVPPADVTALAQALDRLMRDASLRRGMGLAGRPGALEFSPEAAADAFERLAALAIERNRAS